MEVAGQEALKYSIAGQEAARARQKAMMDQPWNVKAGPMRFELQGVLETEANDNINLANRNPKSDVVLRPEVRLRSFWPVHASSALTFDVGVAYDKYLFHPEYDSFQLMPNSQLALDVIAGDYRLDFHDSIAYVQNPTDVAAVSGSVNYGGFSNTAGLRIDKDWHDTTFSLGYDHYLFLSSTRAYDYLNRGSEMLVGQMIHNLSEEVTAGVDASGTVTAYEKPVLQDNVSYSLGINGTWQATSKIKLHSRGGFAAYQFEQQPGRIPANDEQSYYADGGIVHTINAAFSHSIEGGRVLEPGINANLLSRVYGQYGIQWRVSQWMRAEFHFRYENGSERNAQLVQSYNRNVVGTSIVFPISRHANGQVAYDYFKKAANPDYWSYQQNRITFTLSYRF
jgi:hypothetical protein